MLTVGCNSASISICKNNNIVITMNDNVTFLSLVKHEIRLNKKLMHHMSF